MSPRHSELARYLVEVVRYFVNQLPQTNLVPPLREGFSTPPQLGGLCPQAPPTFAHPHKFTQSKVQL